MPDNKVSKKEWFTELGAAGLKRYSGVVDDEFIRDLERADSRFKVYTEMRFNDPVVGSVLFLVEQMLRRVTWLVDPSDPEDPVAVERAEFVDSCRGDLSQTWDDFISECVTFLPYGWSFFEQVFKKRLGPEPPKYTDDPAASKYDDGLIGWRKFAVRAQEALDRWEFDETGGIQGMYQRPAPDYEERYIPIEKALLFRTRVERNSPEGRSVLRHAYRAWYFKKTLEVIMAIGTERQLAGMPIIYLPTNAVKADYDKAREMVERVRRDEYFGVVMQGPEATTLEAAEAGGWLFKLVQSGGRANVGVLEMLEYYDRRMAMAVLAQFLILGSTVGSWALSRDQSDIFLMALEGWATMIAETINRHAIPKLMRMNGWDEKQSPHLEPSGLARANLEEMAQWIKTMFEVGMPVTDLEDQVRAMADLPAREEGEEPLEEEEVPEVEEEEEVEKQEDAWHVRGHVPSADEVESDWEVEESDIEAARRQLAEMIGEPV